MAAITRSGFDYDTVPAEAREFVKKQTDKIRARMQSTAEGLIEIGRALIAVKEQLPHGQFLPWLEAEFTWSERTAQNLMRVATVFKSANVADLGVAPSALYLLAAAPEEVREDLLEKAADGEEITSARVKAELAGTITDETGKAIRDPRIAEVFRQRVEIDDQIRKVQDIKNKILRGIQESDELYSAFDKDQIAAYCTNIIRQYKACRPFALCPICPAGRVAKDCACCQGLGWVGELAFKQAGKLKLVGV